MVPVGHRILSNELGGPCCAAAIAIRAEGTTVDFDNMMSILSTTSTQVFATQECKRE